MLWDVNHGNSRERSEVRDDKCVRKTTNPYPLIR
jgi:hypothetical protein